MIEQGLFKTHFVGKDGFVWWIGQIAPKETWKKNYGEGKLVQDVAQIKGVGTRYRVRIMGYHTANKNELPDNELPFATVIYPITAGSGSGASSQSSNLKQGDFVFGFFLDGDDAQQPVIMGVLGYNDYQKVMDQVPSVAFKPFYGLDGPKPGVGIVREQSMDLAQATSDRPDTAVVDATSTSAQKHNKVSPESFVNKEGVVDKKQIEDPAEAQTTAILSTDRNEIPLAGIQSSLQKAIQQIEQLKASIRLLGAEQSANIDSLKSLINKKIDEAAEMVASAIKWVYEVIEEHVFNKLDDGFKAIYAAARPNEREMVKKTSGGIMDNLACLFRSLFAKLLGMVRDFIVDAVDRIVNVPICFVERFVGNTLGTISGVLEGAMESIQSAIEGVVDFAVEGLDLAGDVMNLISRILSTLNCDTEPEKSQVSEWSLINGQKKPITKGNIANIINQAKKFGENAKKFSLEDSGKFDFIKETSFSQLFDPNDLTDECSTKEIPCGPPKLNIFGSKKGAGAAGNLVINAAGEVIGVDMQSFGVGYDEDTRAVVWDDCGKGKGAVIKPIYGDVFNNFPFPRNNNGRNKGTPAFAPASLGFGPFAVAEYEFDPTDDSSIRLQPYSPLNQAYGTPAYGLGPSVSQIGKETLPTQLGVRESDIDVKFGQEIFTIPVVSKRERVNAKFILNTKDAILQNVATDFDFENADVSGRGKLDQKNNSIFYKGRTVGEIAKEALDRPEDMTDKAYKKAKIRFRELFEEGQRQRVVKGRKYSVRGFQFDGEPLKNPIKISPDGKCILLDGVFGRKVTQEKRTKLVKDLPSKRYIHFDFGNKREQRRFDENPLGFFADKLEKDDTSVRLKDGGGDDRNATFYITNNGERTDVAGPNGTRRKVLTEAKFVIDDYKGKKGLFIEGKGKIWLRLAYDDDPDVAEIAIDRITIHDDEDEENIWQQTKKGEKKPNDGRPRGIIDEGDDAQDNNSIRLHPQDRLETYYVDVLDEGSSDEDYNDMVICCKYGKFKPATGKRLKRDGGVIYIYRDDDGDPGTPGGNDDDPPIDPPPVVPQAPVIPRSIPLITGGGTGGGIPGILTPGPGNNATFHPHPGSTTLGPGKWVVGPIPPGGGGPHLGPAVFVHDGTFVGDLTGTSGTPFESTQKKGKNAKKSGGGGAGASKSLTQDVYVFGSRPGGVNKWGQYEDGTFNSDLWNQTNTKGSKIPKYLKAPKQKSGGAGGGQGDIPSDPNKNANLYGFNNPTNPVFFPTKDVNKIPEYIKANGGGGFFDQKQKKNQYGFNNPNNPVFFNVQDPSQIPEYLKPPDEGGFNPFPGQSGVPKKPGSFGPPTNPGSIGPTGPKSPKPPGSITIPSDPGSFPPGGPVPVPVPPPGGFTPGGIPPGGPTEPGSIPPPGGPTTPHPGPVPPGPGGWFPSDLPAPEIPPGGVPLIIPGYPGILVPGDSGGFDGPGIGVVDIDIIAPGGGYLPIPDGSWGGDGRTWSPPDHTRITYEDGTKELPVPPNNRICLEAGDVVTLPIGTSVTTEPFDGEGGGELIVGGYPHVMQKPGCLTTPDGGERPPAENTYPVLMYLCDVFIVHPGSGYKNTDRVIIEPSMGAEAELVVDKFGRISDVLVTQPGEGFQVIPTITIESSTGQNAQLRAKLCIDRVGEVVPSDQEKVIQVVDCVGTFPL